MIKVSKVILNVFKKFSKDLMKFSNFAFCTRYGLKIVIGLKTKLCVEGCNQQPPSPTQQPPPKQKKTSLGAHFLTQNFPNIFKRWPKCCQNGKKIFFSIFFNIFKPSPKCCQNNNEIFFSKFSSDC